MTSKRLRILRPKSSNSNMLLLSLESNPKGLMGSISNVNTTLCKTFLHLPFILKVNIISIDNILESHNHLKSQLNVFEEVISFYYASIFFIFTIETFIIYSLRTFHGTNFCILSIILALFIINTCLYFFSCTM